MNTRRWSMQLTALHTLSRLRCWRGDGIARSTWWIRATLGIIATALLAVPSPPAPSAEAAAAGPATLTRTTNGKLYFDAFNRSALGPAYDRDTGSAWVVSGNKLQFTGAGTGQPSVIRENVVTLGGDRVFEVAVGPQAQPSLVPRLKWFGPKEDFPFQFYLFDASNGRARLTKNQDSTLSTLIDQAFVGGPGEQRLKMRVGERVDQGTKVWVNEQLIASTTDVSPLYQLGHLAIEVQDSTAGGMVAFDNLAAYTASTLTVTGPYGSWALYRNDGVTRIGPCNTASVVDFGSITSFPADFAHGSVARIGAFPQGVTNCSGIRAATFVGAPGEEIFGGDVFALSYAPVRANGAPSSLLRAGTTSAALSLTTNTSSTCRMAQYAGIAYDSMAATLSTVNGINHSATVSGLADGRSFRYYVRCREQGGVMNDTDYPIAFTVNSAQPLAIVTSELPLATRDAAYRFTLEARGGLPPFTWSLLSGTLPPGLTLDAATGRISGTPTATTAQDIVFRVRDNSAGQASAAAMLKLEVKVPQGGNCLSPSTGLTPLNDLARGFYRGSQGGLYPSGSNVRPANHEQAGIQAASAIQPLDAAGRVDLVQGKYAFISVGMSSASEEFAAFKLLADADPARNPALAIVDGAAPNKLAHVMKDPTDAYWTDLDAKIVAAGLTPQQVVVAWLKNTDIVLDFPDGARKLQFDMASTVQIMKQRFPNLRLTYVSSRSYGGYASSVVSPEPYAYETGFGIKWMIENQITGNTSLNFDAAKGAVMAPWLAWGPYLWADGMTPRSDGLLWACQDFAFDGTHPSASAEDRVARLLLNFLKSDSTASRWFQPPGSAVSR